MVVNSKVEAQRFSKNYTTNEGLANNIVYKIVQSQEGYIWCSTENGLSRFDGFEFENFNVWNGLSDNDNPIFKKDFFGNLWLFGFNGSVTVITEDSIVNIKSIVQTDHKNIEVLSDSSYVYVFDKKGIHYFDKHLNLMKSVLFPKELENKEFYSAIKDSENGFFIFMANQLLHFKNGKFELSRYLEYPYKLQTMSYLLNNNDLIYLSVNGLVEIRDNKAVLLRGFSNDLDNAHPVFLKEEDNIFYSIRNELFRINLKDTSVYELIFKASSPVIDFILDRGGNLWIATHGSGIYSLKYKHQFIKEEVEIKTKDNITQFVIDQDGDYWFVHNKSKVTIFQNGNYYNVPKLHNRSITQVKALLSMGNQIAIGDDHGLLLINDIRSFKQKIIRHKEAVFNYYSNYNMFVGNVKDFEFEDSNKYISMGFAGLYKIRNNRMINIYSKRTYAIADLGNNSVLASTDEGLKLFENGKTYSWPSSLLLKQTFKHLYKIDNNLILFITSNEQFGVFNLNLNKVMLFKIGALHRYLSYNSCTIESKYKWYLCTNKGLILIKANSGNINCSNDNLNFEIIVDQEVQELMIKNRTNYFLTNNKIYSFLNSALLNSEKPNSDLILRLNYENEGNKIVEKTRTKFKYYENNLSFQMADPTFNSEIFRYRIKNEEADWKTIDRNKLSLSNLKPGDYSIEVQSSGANGKWSKSALSSFVIVPRIIDETWFRFGIGFLVMVLILLFFSNIYSRRIESSNQKIKFGLAQLRALNVQMNPHFVVNALSSFQYLVYKEQKEKAIDYLHKFASLFSSILVNSEKQKIALKNELEQLENYINIEQLRFEKELDYLIEVDEILKSENTLLPPMFIQPFVENAIWHGLLSDDIEDPFLLIKFSKEKEYCIVEINDNGIGIKNKNKKTRLKEHESTAMKNILERIDIYNSINSKKIFLQILDKSDIEEKGTLIIIKFPQ